MIRTDGRPTLACCEPPAEDPRWTELRGWLDTPAAYYFVDAAAESCLTLYEASDLLLDHGIVPDAGAMRKLGRLCAEALA